MANFVPGSVYVRSDIYQAPFRPFQECIAQEGIGNPAEMFHQYLSSVPANQGNLEQLSVEDSGSPSSAADENERKHPCNICDKSFKSPYHLRRHANTHAGIYNHLCPVCFKAFRDKAGLKRHYVQHTGDHPCKCRFCGRGFAETAKLNKHLQTHTGDYRFRCEVCGKGFTENYYLKNHMQSHSGIQWYECERCDKKFTCPKSLRRHVAADHRAGDGSEGGLRSKRKIFRCNACHETFNARESYVQHMHQHVLQASPPADSRSTNGKNKNYTCLMCNVSLPDELSFRLHAKVHEDGLMVDVKPKVKKDWKHGPGGPCPLCNKKISRRDHLKRHLWNVHGAGEDGSPASRPPSDSSGSGESSQSSESN